MNEYYKNCLQKGLEYQDFVCNILIDELGISITSYSSIKYQNISGENRQGIEIKFDDKYNETGNIYIETSEKTNANNLNFVKSGIYRNDNTWLYLIGNYDEIFIFSKKYLKFLNNTNKYRYVEIPTSKGFLLPKKDAEKYCIYKIDIKKR